MRGVDGGKMRMFHCVGFLSMGNRAAIYWPVTSSPMKILEVNGNHFVQSTSHIVEMCILLL